MLNERRREAVRRRLDGQTVAEVAAGTGLSAPTVSAAWKAFLAGGWEAVPVRPRGRRAGQADKLNAAALARLQALLAEWPKGDMPAWSSRALADAMQKEGHEISPRAIDHWLAERGLKPAPLPLDALASKRSQAGRWYRQQVAPVGEQVRQAGGMFWTGGVHTPPPSNSDEPRRYPLYLHGKRGVLYTRVLTTPPPADDYLALFERLLAQADGKPVALVFHGAWFQAAPEIGEWLERHPSFRLLHWPAG
jgi:transposase